MKLTKRILSMALSALLVFSLSAFALAKEGAQASVPAEGEDVSHLPLVYLSGGWHSLWENESAENWMEWIAFPERAVPYNRFNEAEPFAPEKMDAVFGATFSLNMPALGEALAGLFTEGYAKCAMDKNGVSLNPNITSDYLFLRDLDLPGSLGLPEGAGVPVVNGQLMIYKNQCMFFMDWRQDPWDLAEKMHTFFKSIVDNPANDFDRVNVVAVSGSGPAMMAYFARYGTEYLASAVINMAMHNGSTLFGGIATGNFGFDASALANTKMYSWGKTELLKQLALPIGALYQPGLLGVGLKAFNFAARDAYARMYDEGLVPHWFYMPFYLCLIPQNQWAQAKQFLFKGNPGGEFDRLIAVADRYHNEVMAKHEELVRKAASEIKMAVRAGYGLPLSPYAQGTNVQSDELVDTAYASMGATVAAPGRPFSPARKGRYVSPDRYVDASTCVLPDQTWFAEGFYHYPEWYYIDRDGTNWLDWFLAAENYTVWGNERFPQYSRWTRVIEDNTTKNYFIPFEQASGPSVSRDILDYLKFGGLGLLQAWRWLILLPLFWI